MGHTVRLCVGLLRSHLVPNWSMLMADPDLVPSVTMLINFLHCDGTESLRLICYIDFG